MILRRLTALLPLLFSSTLAGQNAAPSSHLVYDDASFEGDILINEVRVPKDGEAMHTYYEALGWGGQAGGYAGIQAHPKAHNYIFSIWDHKEHTSPIRAVHLGPGTRTEKFGGEGTGLKSWNFELGWDTDVWYTLVTRCWPVEDHTFYGYWVRSGKTRLWTHLVTMDVAAKDAYLQGGNDSFIEDWLETGKNLRITNLRQGWKRNPRGGWHAFGRAHYSVNSWDLDEGRRSFNFKTNWDAGIAADESGEFYYMKSGGAETTPTCTNPSKHTIKRTEKAPDYAPINVLSAASRTTVDGKVIVTWEIDPQAAPQFSFAITKRDNNGVNRASAPLVMIAKIEPHARSAEFQLPEGTDPTGVAFDIRCRDIFDNPSALTPVN